jgi:hypothetical protein
VSVNEITIRIAGSPGGRVIGLIDADRNVYRQTPSFTRELLGTIDADGIVRLDDGQPVGEPIAMISGMRTIQPSLDPSTAPVMGFINDEGEIRPAGSDRVLGIVDGADPLGMAFFALAFRRLVTEIDELEAEIRSAKNKYSLRDKLQKRAETLTDSDVLGDVTVLIARLARLDAEIEAESGERKAAKERLTADAEALVDSTDWKATGDKLKALFEEWKTVGSAGKEADEALWARFSSAREQFNKRRSADFETRQATRAVAKEKKEAIIAEAETLVSAEAPDYRSVGDKLRRLQATWKEAGSAGRTDDDELWTRLQTLTKPFYEARSAWYTANQEAKEALVARAEELSTGTNFNETSNALKALQVEWKAIGTAGRELDETLWTKFRAANQAFFSRRGEVKEKSSSASQGTQDFQANLLAKADLVKRAQALRWSGDAFGAANEAKNLQAKWKEIGPVPREKSDDIWKLFRDACDKIFANVQTARSRRESEWGDRMKDAMDRKLDQLGEILRSMDRDQEQLDRLKGQLAAKPSPDLEKRVKEIETRIKDKQKRSEQVESSLLEIRDKVHGATA